MCRTERVARWVEQMARRWRRLGSGWRALGWVLASLLVGPLAAGPALAAPQRVSHWPNSPLRHLVGSRPGNQLASNTTPTFSANLRGAVVASGNTLLTCPQNLSAAQHHPAAKAPKRRSRITEPCLKANNNDRDMVYVNVDPSGGHFDSSSSTVSIPGNARVVRAYLYWGADLARGVGANNDGTDDAPGGADPNTNKLWKTSQMRVGTGAYTTVDATSATREGAWAGIPSWYSQPGKNVGFAYQVRADVTAELNAYLSGVAPEAKGNKQAKVTVANVQAGRGFNRHGGWTLVVAWESPTAAFRNITLFDGFDFVQVEGGQELVLGPLNFQGFTTPSSGNVDAQVTTWTYEGDRAIEGDYLALGKLSTTCKGLAHQSDALHPVDNFFNSTISTGGVDLGGREPDYGNQLGFDQSTLDPPEGTIPHNATGASVCLGTDGDTYFFGGLVFDTLIRAPNVQIDKVADRPQASPGESITYTTSVTNPERTPGDPLYPTPTVAATNLTINDPLPSGLDFAGFTSNPGNACSYSAPTRAITCAVGTVAPGGSFSYKFQATVGAAAAGPGPGLLTNTGCYRSNSADQPEVPFNGCSAAAVVVPPLPPQPQLVDLGVVKTVSASVVAPGATLTWSLLATNHGPGTSTGFVLADQLPAGVVFTSLSAPPSLTCSTPPVGAAGAITCTASSVPPAPADGSSLAVTITGRVLDNTPDGELLVNVATVAGDQPEPLPDPNSNRDSTVSRVVVPEKPIPAPKPPIPEAEVLPSGPLELPVAAEKLPGPPGILDTTLALHKQAAPSHVVTGGTVEFKLVVRNTGENTALGVRVCDALPKGLVPASTRGFSVRGRAVCATLSRLAPLAAHTLRFTARVRAGAPRTIRNVAHAHASNARAVRSRAVVHLVTVPRGLG